MYDFLRNIAHLQAIGSVGLLCFFIVATTILQKKAIDKSRDVLETATAEVKRTALYTNAVLYMNRRSEATKNTFTDPTFFLPIYFLVAVVFMCSLVSYFGAEFFTCGDPCQPGRGRDGVRA